MKLQEKLKECRKNHCALLATNFYNYETLKGILAAARIKNRPIILQLTRSSIEYMGLENAVNLGKTALNSFGVEGWIHLDHGDSVELVKQCLDAGFDSVMFDGSELPIEENIILTKKVVKLSKAYDANVEAELGYVAKLGQSTKKMENTRPEDAQRFVKETHVDALAIAIGTSHGFYKETPKLDYDRLNVIEKVIDAALVLHGGSGVPDEAIKKVIQVGICKVNVATEIKDTFTRHLKIALNKSDEIDLRKVFPPAIEAVTHLIKNKLDLMGN